MAMKTPRTQVLHRHRVGRQASFMRVSELVFRGEDAIAVLSWLHDGDKRIPGVFIQLERALLRPSPKRNLYLYDGVTSDPRF